MTDSEKEVSICSRVGTGRRSPPTKPEVRRRVDGPDRRDIRHLHGGDVECLSAGARTDQLVSSRVAALKHFFGIYMIATRIVLLAEKY